MFLLVVQEIIEMRLSVDLLDIDTFHVIWNILGTSYTITISAHAFR